MSEPVYARVGERTTFPLACAQTPPANGRTSIHIYTTTDPIHGERRCDLCKEWLPLDAFSRNPTKSQGRDYRCKTCVNAERREQRARQRKGFSA